MDEKTTDTITENLKIKNTGINIPVENSEQDANSAQTNSIAHAEQPTSKEKSSKPTKPKKDKKTLAFLIAGIVGIVGGLSCVLIGLLIQPQASGELDFPKLDFNKSDGQVYSDLTGEALASEDLKTTPAYCIQTPNGTDGGRPQAGINEAGVVFEAIAEAGITRFAAIYQNPSTAIIGPVRSLRIYYLEWDTPFDCTIVHAGGAENAINAVAAGGYKDLSEDYSYMYRGTYGNRLWNNLFTTSNYLKKFSSDHGYNTSNIKGFKRMTPEESDKSRIAGLADNPLVITRPSEGNTSATSPAVSSISLRFGGFSAFNVNYQYNSEENTYARSYENGDSHNIYQCPDEDLGEKNPEDVCTLTQLAPSVVIAMVVQESLDYDGYHESITTTGSGTAYIFQNGTVIEGKWEKPTVADQIKFIDADGGEIALAPGQTFISAVPTYGSVDY